MKKLLCLAACLLLVSAALSGCWLRPLIDKESGVTTDVPNPVVTMNMQDGGVIKLELYPSVAPNTVANFVTLIESGYYNGTYFHRVIPGFMIQGGDPTGKGNGGPDYTIRGEFAMNGFRGNELKHTRGVVSMARAEDYNSAGSQFFIMHADADYLDDNYAAFGRVTSGMDVVDAIANLNRDTTNKPLRLDLCTISTMTVDTFGYKYEVVKYSSGGTNS